MKDLLQAMTWEFDIGNDRLGISVSLGTPALDRQQHGEVDLAGGTRGYRGCQGWAWSDLGFGMGVCNRNEGIDWPRPDPVQLFRRR